MANTKSVLRSFPSLLKETAIEWNKDNAMRLAAALAYYTAFSLAPMVLAGIAISGLIFGREAASGQIFAQLHSYLGSSAAEAMEELTKAASKPSTGVLGAVIALGLSLFGASGVFGELKSSLNEIWGIKTPEGNGVLGWIRDRFFSVTMVMGVCFLLLVSMAVSTLLSTFGSFGFQGNQVVGLIILIFNLLVSLGIITSLFAALFRYIPSTRIEWRDVWVGAAFTSVLFNLGKFALEQYMGKVAPASSFGAASSLALVLVWVYYSAQIFLFGAEFTEVYSRRFGSLQHKEAAKHPSPHGVPPPKNAVVLN